MVGVSINSVHLMECCVCCSRCSRCCISLYLFNSRLPPQGLKPSYIYFPMSWDFLCIPYSQHFRILFHHLDFQITGFSPRLPRLHTCSVIPSFFALPCAGCSTSMCLLIQQSTTAPLATRSLSLVHLPLFNQLVFRSRSCVTKNSCLHFLIT